MSFIQMLHSERIVCKETIFERTSGANLTSDGRNTVRKKKKDDSAQRSTRLYIWGEIIQNQIL